MPHRRATDTEPMDRILLWAVQAQAQWRLISTELSPDTHRIRSPHPTQKTGGCSTTFEERKVSRSWKHSSRTRPSRWRSSKYCSHNKIWQTGEWPTPWTQSLVITLLKKGNLQQYENYRTIRLISHPSKVILKIILNRLKPQAEKIIA